MKTSMYFAVRSQLKVITAVVFLATSLSFIASCRKDDDEILPITETPAVTVEPFDNPKYTTTQTVSDEAQKNTMAFDALGFMTGNFGSQTFLPPGKVADYSGFQYFRDNDQTSLGHNTSFVTIIASNMLNTLTDAQIAKFVNSAKIQIDQINEYAYMRLPLCKAFRQLIDGELPAGKTELDEDAVKSYSAELYKLDGEISYNRAQLFGEIIASLSTEQVAKLAELKALNGVGNWPSNLADKLGALKLNKDVNVAVMTYASEMYAWYSGSVTADVYFCPERQGTYFGSFYLKDWPAMGNPNYTIDEQLTANAGQNFFKILNTTQNTLFSSIVTLQKEPLLALVNTRTAVSTELRKFKSGLTADAATIQTLSEQYGQYDGEIIYLYAKYFSEVYNSMSADQKQQLTDLADQLGYIDPSGAFLYSDPITMPTIASTDFLFK